MEKMTVIYQIPSDKPLLTGIIIRYTSRWLNSFPDFENMKSQLQEWIAYFDIFWTDKLGKLEMLLN